MCYLLHSLRSLVLEIQYIFLFHSSLKNSSGLKKQKDCTLEERLVPRNTKATALLGMTEDQAASYKSLWELPCGSDGKDSAFNAEDPGLIPGSERSSGERNGYSVFLNTAVFLPREFHGVGSLKGYSPWGHKELDTTE